MRARRDLVIVAAIVGGALSCTGLAGIEPCPPGSLPEPEACGDDTSGGCSASPPFWIGAHCGDVYCGTAWADGGTRDTDWYLLEVEDPDGNGVQTITGELISDFPGVCFIVDNAELCTPVVIGTPGSGDDTMNLELAWATVPAPQPIVIFVATQSFDGFPCGTENEYLLTIGCLPGCPGDLDLDGRVGVEDLVLLVTSWGECPGPGCPADVNHDQAVGVLDLVEVIVHWGACAAP